MSSSDKVGYVAAVTKDEVQLLQVAFKKDKVETEVLGKYAMGANSADGFLWSSDGNMFAVINKDQGVDVFNFPTLEKVCSFPCINRGIKTIALSPKNTFLLIGESAFTAKAPGAAPMRENAEVHHLMHKKVGTLRVRRLTEPFWPAMRWTTDELFCFRVVEFQDLPANSSLSDNAPSLAANSAVMQIMNTRSNEMRLLAVPGLTAVAVGPAQSTKVCCFFGRGDDLQSGPGNGAAIEIVELSDTVASPSAYRTALQDPADSATMVWNSRGDKLLIAATVEVDETGRTYYGRSMLYVLTEVEGANNVQSKWTMKRAANEVGQPLHDAKWSPAAADIFAAVAGAMPGNVGLYQVLPNGRILVQRSLGHTIPRNTLRFSPNGRFLAVGGFGALPGDVDFWDVSAGRCLKSIRTSCTVDCTWTPTGVRAFATCTTSPRMRVDNAISVFNYDGSPLLTLDFPTLYAAAWRPAGGEVDDEPSSPRVLAAASVLPVVQNARKTYKPPGVDGAAFAAAVAAANFEADTKKRRTYERTPGAPGSAKPSKWDNFPDRSAAATAEPAAPAVAAATSEPPAPAPPAAPAVVAPQSVSGLRPLPHKEWFYRDLDGAVQGPFTLKSMQSWCKQGYFADDLELRVGSDASRKFVALRLLFPTPTLTPFKDHLVWPWN